MKIKLVLTGLTLVIGLLMMGSGSARAEGGCPPGMLPASGTDISSCAPIPGSSNGAAQQRNYPRYADKYGGHAIDENDRLSWSTNYDSAREAEKAALAVCSRAGAKSCRSLGTFWNGCATYASDPAGNIYVGYHSVPTEAARGAIAECNKKSSGGKCRLMAFPVCSGGAYSDSLSDLATNATAGQLELKSAQLDTRRYWGAIASDGSQIQGGYDQPDPASAEALALGKCPGCKIIRTFESSCAGIAWPSDNRPFNETALDVDATTAKTNALNQCKGKYGACTAGVRCTGRRYDQTNPDAPAPPPVSAPPSR